MGNSIFNKEEFMNFLETNYNKTIIGNSYCKAIDNNNIEVIMLFDNGFEILHKRFNPDRCEDEVIKESGFIDFEDCPRRIELKDSITLK